MIFLMFFAFNIIFVNAGLNSRIVGGYYATNGQFPYMASLRTNRNQHFCGGSIISQNWILTAGHCALRKSPYDVTIVVGSNSLKGGTKFPASLIVVHPHYRETPILNDIALIKTKGSLVFSRFIQQIPLNSRILLVGQKAVVSGWGKISAVGTASNTLKYLNVNLLSSRKCSSLLQSLPKDDVCVHATGIAGVCSGDSGSPMVSKGLQIGIVSRGTPPCGFVPDIFTKVDAHLPWIQSIANI